MAGSTIAAFDFPALYGTPDLVYAVARFREDDNQFIESLETLREQLDGPTKPDYNANSMLLTIEANRSLRNRSAHDLSLLVVQAFDDTRNLIEPTARAVVVNEAQVVSAIAEAESIGWEQMDSENFSVAGVHIGHVFVKFDPNNVAMKFLIISVVPD